MEALRDYMKGEGHSHDVAQMDDRPHHRPWGHTHEECATRSGHVSQSNFILSEAEHYRGEGGASEINAIIFSSFERD